MSYDPNMPIPETIRLPGLSFEDLHRGRGQFWYTSSSPDFTPPPESEWEKFLKGVHARAFLNIQLKRHAKNDRAKFLSNAP